MTDIDLLSLKGLPNGLQLLYIVEQKQPGHRFVHTQPRMLKLLDACVKHCIWCPAAVDLRLDERSGLMILQGQIAGSQEGRHETGFAGPQILQHVRCREPITIAEPEDLFRVLDPVDVRRRQSVGWKMAC